MFSIMSRNEEAKELPLSLSNSSGFLYITRVIEKKLYFYRESEQMDSPPKPERNRWSGFITAISRYDIYVQRG